MTSKFRSDTAIYGLTQVAERLISFFLLPLLTKTTSAEEYGIWSQLIVVAGISTPVVLLGLQTALVRYLPRWRDALQVQYSMMLRTVSAVTSVFLVMAIVLIFFQLELGIVFFGASEHAIFVPMLAGLILTEVLSEFLVAVLRAEGFIRRLAYYLLFKSAARISILLVVLGYLGGGFQAAVLSFVVCQFCIVLLFGMYEMPVRRIARAGLVASRPYWRETLKFALPIVVLAVLTGLNNFADRFFLTYFLGVHEVAVYAAGYSLAGIAGFFYSVLGFSLFPAMSACWAAGHKDAAAQLLGKTVQVYLFLLLPFVFALGICGPEILVLLATQQYYMSGFTFFLLAAAVGLFGVYQLGAYAVILGERSVDTMRLMCMVVMINLSLNTVLIPLWGVVGAALATCLANGILAIRTVTVAWKILPLGKFIDNLRPVAGRSVLSALFLFLGKAWIQPNNLFTLTILLSFAAIIYIALDYFGSKSTLRFLMAKSTNKI
jgi:O-antigen/teichoic acid export membrane protein